MNSSLHCCLARLRVRRAFGWLAEEPALIHVYQYSSGFPEDYGYARLLWSSEGKELPLAINKAQVRTILGGAATLKDVFESLRPEPTNFVEYLYDTLGYIRLRVESGDEENSIVLIITHGWLLEPNENPARMGKKLESAAKAWRASQVPIGI